MITIESYEVNHTLYVTAKFLSSYFSRSSKQISRWVQDGLPIEDKPNELMQFKGNLFLLNKCVDWVDKNINKTKARATSKKEINIQNYTSDDDMEDTVNDIQGKIKQANEMLQLKTTSHDDADRIKKILDGLIQSVKLGEQTKELIPKKDTEKVIIEFVSTLIAGYKRDIKILPKELQKRDEKDIRAILDKTYKSNIEKYKKMAKSSVLNEAKLYDVIEVVIDMINDEVSIDEIIKKIKG